jgi:hypothetical protein
VTFPWSRIRGYNAATRSDRPLCRRLAIAASARVSRSPIAATPPVRLAGKVWSKAIQSLAAAYENATFSYIAVNRMDEFVLMHGRIFLNIQPSAIPLSHFQSKSVRAGHYRLADLKMDARALIECIFSGKLETPHGSLSFPASDDGTYASNCGSAQKANR